jgi:hypothetical protein
MRTRNLSLLLFAAALALGLACGGGSSTPAPTATAASTRSATMLSYKDPAGSGWRLVKDESSTATLLVLNLIGPGGLKTRGVGFNLQAPTGVKFVTFGNGLPINDLGVYQLHMAGSADPSEPLAITGGVKKGNLLSVGIYQKDRDQAAQDSGAALCQIALQLDPAGKVPLYSTVALTIPKAKVIPEDIGAVTDDLWTLDKKMRMTDITIAVGTLTAN